MLKSHSPSEKCSAVFCLKLSTVSSSSAHSNTRRLPYKCVLWQRLLNARWEGKMPFNLWLLLQNKSKINFSERND